MHPRPVHFDDHVFELLWRRYPSSAGWSIERGYALDSGGRIDFLLDKDGGEIIVVMLRGRGNLIYDQVDLARGFGDEVGAREVLIYLSRDAGADATIAEYAKRCNVRLERTDFAES
jgi:hypothetical protein